MLGIIGKAEVGQAASEAAEEATRWLWIMKADL